MNRSKYSTVALCMFSFSQDSFDQVGPCYLTDLFKKKQYCTLRRKEREEKAPAKGTRTSKRKAAEKSKAKAPPKKKAKTADETENDAEIAAKLADTRGSGRNRDATGVKSKKAAALAALREVSGNFSLSLAPFYHACSDIKYFQITFVYLTGTQEYYSSEKRYLG